MRTALLPVSAGLGVGLIVIAGWSLFAAKPATAHQIRQELMSELEPIALENCTLQRIGSRADGGYLMCVDLLGGVGSAYSYGIAGDDNWGCQISKTTHVPVHQYDCFDTTEPPCPGGNPHFHSECVGPKAESIDSRAFDSVTNQISKNGDSGKAIVMKMDVEGAELGSLMGTSDEVLDHVVQLAIELHAADQRYLDLVRKLKRTFVVAHLHFNNSRCSTQWKPFPSSAYEVLFVNKRLAIPAQSQPKPVLPNPLDAQNTPFHQDCQGLIDP